jgi:hypothetical protein
MESGWLDSVGRPAASIHHNSLGCPKKSFKSEMKTHLLAGSELSDGKWEDNNWLITHLNE